MSDKVPILRPARCPICGRPAVEEVRPFCSKRCADIDLSRWLAGAYVIPGTETEDEPATDGDPNEAEW